MVISGAASQMVWIPVVFSMVVYLCRIHPEQGPQVPTRVVLFRSLQVPSGPVKSNLMCTSQS